jgi:hypothetical protein
LKNYEPQLPDEIAVRQGDIVRISHHYFDGWCYGENLSRGTIGSFPVGCTIPTKPFKVILINIISHPQETMGQYILDGVKLSYPDLFQQFQVPFEVLETTTKSILDANPPKCKDLMVVCGPVNVNSAIVDVISEYKSTNIRILTSDTIN